MKKFLFLLTILFSINSFSQEVKYKEYSYTELFKMIEEEQDSIFTLEDAIIRFDIKTDSIYAADFQLFTGKLEPFRKEPITIDKELKLHNVQFLPYSVKNTNPGIAPKPFGTGFFNMVFLKSVTLNNTISLLISNCTFKQAFILSSINDELIKSETYIENNINEIINGNNISYQGVLISNNTFTANFRLYIHNYSSETLSKIMVNVDDNLFNGDDTYVRTMKVSAFSLENNKYNSITRPIVVIRNNLNATIENNQFNTFVNLIIDSGTHSQNLTIQKNIFPSYVMLTPFSLPKTSNIDWKQWQNKIVLSTPVYNFNSSNVKVKDSLFKINPNAHREWLLKKERIDNYVNNAQTKIAEYYLEEIKFRYGFYNHYKSNYDLEKANLVYTDIKDLETKRFSHLYSENPSFKTFFKWRINQFLKVFSAYGTEPERAVIFSMYVILLFAFIYLLFPNSWDRHGRKRFINRFLFFEKYLRRKDGMHTLYLEENQEEISSYSAFKESLEKSQVELPHFFIAWSKPLYNVSMFSSRMMTRFLKTTDILEGKWIDLNPKQKRWKNIQIGSLLILGLFYDVFIRALNALMLSINTFTTLGFGEIPIKGLPRYLAIIQGFIGWFMLTIFSVSLISQLLN